MIALWLLITFAAAVVLVALIVVTMEADRHRMQRNRPVIHPSPAGFKPHPPPGPGSSVPPKRWSE